MGISTELQYATLDELYLDAKNPRLGRYQTDANLSQEEIIEMMNDWVLDELAISYLESGFWTHEALLVVKEALDGEQRLVVVEGNRRLAALIYLRRAINGEKVSKKWSLLVEGQEVPVKLFNEIPYIQIDSRQEVESFLAFHHDVTGIKQWTPEQKAQYIAKLIDERGMSYNEVMRKIGSNASSTIRQYYVSYQVLLQMEACLENFSVENIEGRFSVLYLSLRMPSVQKYLGIEISANPKVAQTPVPKTHLNALANFALWLFGSQQYPPLFTDSRYLDNFATILENPEAVQYLENSKKPNFEYAFQLTRGDESEIIGLINGAGDNIAIALSRIHHYKDSPEIQRAVKRLAVDCKELLDRSPSFHEEFLGND
ncbi:MAG: hypothetical protein OXC79_02055 [Candidatus Poribacteria bacterium]|nr:hypothetical protein [Candidatus Poribacteria bacterium]